MEAIEDLKGMHGIDIEATLKEAAEDMCKEIYEKQQSSIPKRTRIRKRTRKTTR